MKICVGNWMQFWSALNIWTSWNSKCNDFGFCLIQSTTLCSWRMWKCIIVILLENKKSRRFSCGSQTWFSKWSKGCAVCGRPKESVWIHVVGVGNYCVSYNLYKLKWMYDKSSTLILRQCVASPSAATLVRFCRSARHTRCAARHSEINSGIVDLW